MIHLTNIMEYSCILIAAVSSTITIIYLKIKGVNLLSLRPHVFSFIYYSARIIIILSETFPQIRCFADYPAATLLFYYCTRETNKTKVILPFLIASITLSSLDIALFCIFKRNMIFLYTLNHPVFLFKEHILQTNVMDTNRNFPTILEEESPKYNTRKENKRNQKAELFMRLTEYMEKKKPYLKCNLTVIDVARALCTNKTYISNVINEVTKGNFKQYINEYRIQYAQHLLLENNMLTIKEVANIVGFCSVSAFHETFKQKIGKSPKEWLRENYSNTNQSTNQKSEYGKERKEKSMDAI